MSEYNFFEPYIEPPQKVNYERLVWIIVIIGLLFAILMNWLAMQSTISQRSAENERIYNLLNSSDMMSKLSNVTSKTGTRDSLQSIAQKLNVLDTAYENMSIYNSDLFQSIEDRVPENVFVNTLNFNDQMVSIEGISKTIDDAAVFSHQLLDLNNVIKSEVNQVTKTDGGYNYTINLILDGGSNDEGE